MPPPETYKREIGSKPTMCQVRTGEYVSLLEPGKTDYIYRLPPEKDYHVYIARSTYHDAFTRQTQVNWKKHTRQGAMLCRMGSEMKREHQQQLYYHRFVFFICEHTILLLFAPYLCFQ